MFAVVTVDWLLNRSKAHVATMTVLQAQQKTDELITDLSEPELELLREKIFQIRDSILHSMNAEEAVELYFRINEELLRKCFSMHQPRHEIPSPSLAFILFIQGAVKKFEEIALGSLYLKSNGNFSTRLKTKFLTSHVEADELIRTSLQFVPQARAAWWESQYEHPIFSRVRDSVYTGKRFEKKFDNLSRKNLVKLHSKLARKQMKSLSDTRAAMNDLFTNWIVKIEKHSQNSLSFHLSLAGAAVIVLLFSIVIIGCSLREFGGASSHESNSTYLTKCSNNSLIVHMDEKQSLTNTFVCSSAITEPTVTSLDGDKNLISS